MQSIAVQPGCSVGLSTKWSTGCMVEARQPPSQTFLTIPCKCHDCNGARLQRWDE